ncbi:hypothetical protein [Candidatus Nitrospira salsa]
MFNQKWEKVRRLAYDYRKIIDMSCRLLSINAGKSAADRRVLAYGMICVLTGCSLESTSLQLGVRDFQVMSVVRSLYPAGSHRIDDRTLSPHTNIAGLANSRILGEGDRHATHSSYSHLLRFTSAEEQKPSLLVPKIPDNANGEMVVTYKSKIEETKSLMRHIDEHQLSKEQHDTYNSIHSFLEKSQEAFSQNDMSMAVNLAEKAHTLAQEIFNNSTTP